MYHHNPAGYPHVTSQSLRAYLMGTHDPDSDELADFLSYAQQELNALSPQDPTYASKAFHLEWAQGEHEDGRLERCQMPLQKFFDPAVTSTS